MKIKIKQTKKKQFDDLKFGLSKPRLHYEGRAQ